MKSVLITSVGASRDGISISYNNGSAEITVSYPSKAVIRSLFQEIDDQIERSLILMLVALYVRQTGDNTLADAETGLIGKSVSLDLSKLTGTLSYS